MIIYCAFNTKNGKYYVGQLAKKYHWKLDRTTGQRVYWSEA